MEKVDRLISDADQFQIDKRAKEVKGATDRENLGLSIKHDTVATIKKVGDTLTLTNDELAFVIQELKRCRNDIVYFAEKYFRIIGDGGLQIIKLYPKQKEMLLAMQRERRLIVLSPRQVGKSTTYSIYFLWQAMFYPDKRIAIAADAAAKAQEILSRIKLAYEYLPKEIKPAVTAYNSDQLAFDNNSEIRAFATGGNTLAGFSCVVGDTLVTVVDDFGGIWHTRIDKVEKIANSSRTVNNNGVEEFAMKKYNFVYKTVNLINKKEYIGVHSTDDLDDGYLGSGTVLIKAVEKYGPDNFARTIIKMCDSVEEAYELESNMVNEEYVKREDTYNVTLGGGQPPVCSGDKNGYYGKHHDDQARERMRLGQKEYWSCHESQLIGYNFCEDDDVIVDGIRYNSIHDMSVKLQLWQDQKIMELLLKDGNGFVDSARQEQLKHDYQEFLRDKQERHQRHLVANKLSHNTPEYKKAASERLLGKKHDWQDKINKDPEKIRKTAEKHRGMKRSAEARKNMSEARKRFIKLNGGPSNKGKILITNVNSGEHKYIDKDQEIPEGWKRGLCKS